MTVAIEIKGLVKMYGATRALQGLDMVAERGDIYGFLGPNGAGKTTTLRILATLLRPEAGSAAVHGYNVVKHARHVRRLIGYMPDESGAYRDMQVGEYLEFFASAYEVPSRVLSKVVDDCLELTGMASKKDTLIEGLSRGMRQRLGLARCLINDPRVLLLDEPASGLDPRARLEVQEILRTLGQMGKTILISSHILAELHQMCNKIGIIQEGKIIYSGTIAEALARARPVLRLDIHLADGANRARDIMADRPEVRDARLDDGHVLIELAKGIDDYSFVADVLVLAGCRILTIKEEEVLLQDAFLRLTDGLSQES